MSKPVTNFRTIYAVVWVAGLGWFAAVDGIIVARGMMTRAQAIKTLRAELPPRTRLKWNGNPFNGGMEAAVKVPIP